MVTARNLNGKILVLNSWGSKEKTIATKTISKFPPKKRKKERRNLKIKYNLIRIKKKRRKTYLRYFCNFLDRFPWTYIKHSVFLNAAIMSKYYIFFSAWTACQTIEKVSSFWSRPGVYRIITGFIHTTDIKWNRFNKMTNRYVFLLASSQLLHCLIIWQTI